MPNPPPTDEDIPRPSPDASPSPGAPPPLGASVPPSSYDDPRDDRPRGRLGGIDQFLPDVLKRTFYAGIGALFTTEEGIRKMASDFHLPKDVATYLINQAATSKDDLFRVVGKEVRGFLEGVNVSGEMRKLLTSLSFEIKTEIRFIPNDESVTGMKADIRPDVKVKRTDPPAPPPRRKPRAPRPRSA